MEALLLPLVILVVLFVVIGVLQNLKKSQTSSTEDALALAYRNKDPLFTPAERSFYGVLQRAVDKDRYQGLYQSFGQSPVADILEPQPSHNRSQWQKAINSISAKHSDFVVCKADDLTPVAVIELDDKSHNQKHRQKRDELLNNICKQAELPMLQVPAQWAYKVEVVRMMLVKELENSTENERNLRGVGAG